MKIFLSALENAQISASEYNSNPNIITKSVANKIINNGIQMQYNLMSYYYIKGKKEELAKYIRDNTQEILIDSGAHSFQFGKKVNWTEYTYKYAEFIKKFDRQNVVGYFEMDIENIIGYKKVKELRKILENVSNKIIPVWHPDRGINEYEKMCQEYKGKIIAVGGFRNTDIKDSQYLMFIKVARKYNCKVHCLGMTRTAVLDKVPFDFTDSSTWSMKAIRGIIGNTKNKVTKEFSKNHRGIVFLENYKIGLQMQKHYYSKWQKECND